jgi:type I restriction enzyme S subunit
MSSAISIEQRRLKYAATINDESLTEATEPDYELQYIDIGNVDSYGTVHDVVAYKFEDAPSRARRIARHGDVIVSTVRTYLQAIAPIENPPENLIVSTGFAVVRPKGSLFDARFCKYAVREKHFLWEVESRSTGVSYPAINASDLADIRINLPDVETQNLIADYLDRETARIDALLAEKEKMLALLEEKRAALISRAVTRGLDASAPLKPSGLDWLGDIPAHWDVLPLRWFMRIGSGEFLSNEVISKDETGEILIPVVGGNGVLGYTSQANTENALVIGRVGAQCGNVHFVDGPLWVTDNALLVKITARFDPRYLREVLHLMELNTLANQSAQPLITGEMVKNQKVPAPPMSEQSDILQLLNEALGEYVNLLKAVESSLRLLKERRAALITAAVTGQIPAEEMQI